MSTYQELLAEIAAFKPLTTPCEGSVHPWIHRPERIVDGLRRAPGIRCGCGKVFEGYAWLAPVTQPAPELWSAFQDFKAHYESLL
jgi:hypothetical protein